MIQSKPGASPDTDPVGAFLSKAPPGGNGPRSLRRTLQGAAVAAAVSAAIAGACLVVAAAMRPDVTIEMDRLPPSATGFYPAEHAAGRTFAWTAGRADIAFEGMNRRSPWACAVDFSGARPDAAMVQPDVAFAVDGMTVAIRAATNEFQRVNLTALPRPSTSGLTLSIISSATFVPGDRDKRALGVQVDRVFCRPIGRWGALPPLSALRDTSAAAAAFGAAFGLIGGSIAVAVLAGAAIGIFQAVALSAAGAAYGPYPTTLAALAAWIAVSLVVAAKLLQARARHVLQPSAVLVLGFSAAALYVKLLGLMHPAKALVDAVFHAHRLEWVLDGRFYFTQLSTSATPFPYAIGLYLFAAPWALLTHDHVALLRVVVCTCDAIAGALLYVVITRAWGDRMIGATAAVLFSFVPISYAVIGNANLTNAFGQSVGVVTMAAVVVWAFGPRRGIQMAGLALLATLGFISHVSTLVLLLATLLAAGLFYQWLGASGVRIAGRSVLVATLIALGLSIGLYWGHFGSVYGAQLTRLRPPRVAGTGGSQAPVHSSDRQASGPARGAASPGVGRPALGRTALPLSRRAGDAVAQTIANLGWPILLLALVGAWRLCADGMRDRLGLVLAAWGAVWFVFVGFSVLSPGDMRYQQDAWEFIGRVEHATCAAAVILAARGAVWAWRAGVLPRLAASGLLAAAALLGVRAWGGWL
jgi:hypothetical protein